MEKRYNFSAHESRIYAKEEHFFNPSGQGKPYCVMMPPPNVTGVLHVGHALTFTIQDILIRYHRMQGYDVLWQPGTDHAGIATQMVVERELNKQKIKRTDLSREEFIHKCFEWKQYSQTNILDQQKRLGISPDWSRLRFTMDEGLSKAVTKIFKKLFDDGIIYRDKRLVNWDFKLNTALSDLEVVQKETQDNYYYIRYLVKGGEEIIIATTRPETLFGDTAIAVHPDDERYQHLIGKTAIVPICLREIPIVADQYPDPSKGTGAVKITPAHDFNDYEVGKRHNLPIINLLDDYGLLNENAPLALQGLNVIDARKKTVSLLADITVKVETVKHAIPVSEKNGERVEPFLTDQWYVDAAKLVQPALSAVNKGELNFIPEQWVNTYKHWLENIEPWCISRQLWWGHQIPVWYGPNGEIFCAENEEEAQKQAGNIPIQQDPDVLDTWFSSALWPFSTLGWPDKTEDLSRYFPTSALVTGFDIIFFWVARMVMMSYYIFGKSPFHDVYIHALVRDAHGQKMSKTKGNVIDPIVLIDKYGADTLRLTLAALSVPGRDVALGEKALEGYSHFITKLWNAGRFLETYTSLDNSIHDPEAVHAWMADAINQAIEIINDHIANYRFDLYVKSLYQLVWGQFCDTYLEAIKALANPETIKKAKDFFQIILHLIHPIMPFVTEVLSEQFGEKLLIHSDWPKALSVNEDFKQEFDRILNICQTIKFIKSALDIKHKITLGYGGPEEIIIATYTPYIQQSCQVTLGEVSGLTIGDFILDCSNVDPKRINEKRNKLLQDQAQCQNLLANERFRSEKPDVYAEKIELDQTIKRQIEILDLIKSSL